MNDQEPTLITFQIGFRKNKWIFLQEPSKYFFYEAIITTNLVRVSSSQTVLLLRVAFFYN